MNRAKNFWILLLLLMTGIVLGGFIGNMASGVRGLSWLNYGQSFGLMDPVVLDLGIGYHVWSVNPGDDGEHHRRCHCTDRISSDLIKESRLVGMAFCMQRRGTQEDNQ